MRRSKTAGGVECSSHAPAKPPTRLGINSQNSRGSAVPNSRRYPQALATIPGQIATELVALAVTELSPSQISVGNVTSVPPPATELMTPARKAAPNAARAWTKSSEATGLFGRDRDLRFAPHALHELANRHRPPEKVLDVLHRGVVHSGRTGGHRGIGDEDGPIVQEEGVAQGRFHADVRRDTGEEQIPHAAFAQLFIERGVREPAVACLDDCEVPRAERHQLSFELRPAVHHADAEFLVPVRRTGTAAVAQVGLVAHL